MMADIVRQARQTDLAEWLRMNGEPLKRAGQWWCLEKHGSLRIQGNKWYHNSQGKGGNSIDFLVYYYQMTPKQAIARLIQPTSEYRHKEKGCGVKEKNKLEPAFDYTSVVTNGEYRRVIAYLVKSRGISGDVVMDEIKNKRLYQEKGTANAVFAALNEAGEFVGAELNGTLSYIDARYKGIKAGSLPGYGFNSGQRHNPSYILFFESSIDLLSFITMSCKRPKLLSECLLVSMAGLKPIVVETTLQAFGHSTVRPVFCVDNDAAGDAFVVRGLKDFPNALVRRPDSAHKDWNDQLCNDRRIW
jgi:hypothetical protein